MRPSVFRHKNGNINVENITSFGVWLNDNKKEYAIPFSEFSRLKKASVEELMNPVLYHGFHLCWEGSDVDIDLRSLDHLEDVPLYFETGEPASYMPSPKNLALTT